MAIIKKFRIKSFKQKKPILNFVVRWNIGKLFTFSPPIKIDPFSGEIRPVTKLKIVDFPTPLGPSIPKISALLISKFIFSKICLFPNDSEIFSSFKIA